MEFPLLSDGTIESHAHATLVGFYSWLGRDISMPVRVEIMAEQYLGYDIEVTNEGLFSDPDYLGGIVFDDKVIKINAAADAHEGRYNFTLAHEIGHNFGSPHDYPSECRPGGKVGNYIMFASATSGDRDNNNKFSHCSKVCN